MYYVVLVINSPLWLEIGIFFHTASGDYNKSIQQACDPLLISLCSIRAALLHVEIDEWE